MSENRPNTGFKDASQHLSSNASTKYKHPQNKISIKNIWFLLLYASDLYKYVKRSDMDGAEKNPDKIPGLVAEMLVDAVWRRLRHAPSLKYRIRSDDLRRVRGSIDLLRTETQDLLQRGRVACAFDDLTADTPSNRFVRAALIKMTKTVQLHRHVISNSDTLASRCRAADNRLGMLGVKHDHSLGSRRMLYSFLSLERTSRLDAQDKDVLAAARLAFMLDLPIGHPDYSNDERLWELFEKAVFGFYRFHFCKQWEINRQRHQKLPIRVLQTNLLAKEDVCNLVPKMMPDIIMESEKTKITIDTKYANILKPNSYSDKKLISANIYQMYTYLRSQEKEHDRLSKRSVGILLYADTGEITVDINIQGHNIRFASVDLSMDSESIRQRLKDVVGNSFGDASVSDPC